MVRDLERRGYFHAGKPTDPRRPYTIVIPPPNVTALHLGHALNNTLQDMLIRMKRMQGYNALWMPGTDHAGIATQAVVERRLLEEEDRPHDLGRKGWSHASGSGRTQYEARIIRPAQEAGLQLRLGADAVHPRRHIPRAVRQRSSDYSKTARSTAASGW